MKKIYLATVLFVHLYGASFAQTLEWARNMGSPQFDFGFGVSVDDEGNVYSTGAYFGRADFDPNIPGPELDSFGYFNIFVQKHDALGNFLWAKGMGGQDRDDGTVIKTDHEGNVYTTGYFQYSVDFDPGPGEFYLTAPNAPLQSDIFIQKLDTDGNFIWARSFGFEGGHEMGYMLAVDENQNVYIGGIFSGTVDFDPRPDVFNLTSAGESDAFIVKLDSQGNFVWAQSIGGAYHDSFLDMDIDPATGDLIIGGEFSGMVDLDPGTGVFTVWSPLPETNGVILKLDSDGNFIWAKALLASALAGVAGIDIDQFGNVYAAGIYYDSLDLDPGPGTFYAPSDNDFNSEDAFILKLDPAGNFIWAATIVGQNAENAFALRVDEEGNVYTVGRFGWTSVPPPYMVDFDPGPGVFNLTCENRFDAFIQKLDANGNFVWAHKISGVSTSAWEEANAVTVDQYANVYVVGNFRAGDFDPGPDVFNIASSGGDIFVLKWSQCGPTSSVIDAVACDSYTLNNQTYTETGTYFQVQDDSLGCYIKVTLNLTIHTPGSQALTISTCEPYALNGQVYSESGVYTQTLTGSNGCDSLLTLNLTINTTDASVIQQGTTLTANTAGAVYQWVDCGQNFEPIAGETGQSFTPTATGNYAVMVEQNGCPALSDCFAVTIVGTAETHSENNWQVYPNPTNGKVSFAIPGGSTNGISIDIRNGLGQFVHQQTSSGSDVLTIDPDLPAGMYNTTIRSGKQQKTIILLVE